MIYAVATHPVELLLEGADPGIAAALTVEVYDPTDATSVLTPDGAGITEPRPGTYRAERTIPVDGSFLVRWAQDGTALAEEEILVGPRMDVDWAPGLLDVAALLHARTYVGGTQIGTFNDDTIPTGDQVAVLIEHATADLAAAVADTIPVEWWPEARQLAALQAAALVEASYFPQELETDRSAHRQYRAMYLAGIDRLRKLGRQSASTQIGSIFTSPTSLLTYYDGFP